MRFREPQSTRQPVRKSRRFAQGQSPSRGPSPSQWDQLRRNLGNHVVEANHRSAGDLQTKLKVGASNDRFEREADRVADQVMRMPLPDQSSVSAASPGIQRSCAACAAGGSPCSKCGGIEEEDGQTLRAKAAPGRGASLGPKALGPVAAQRGGGDPLAADQRAFFEPRFGVDFSGVRIHRGPGAATAARAVGARAYTLGRDVVFGQGEYRPETPTGRRLLAHELTHVVQQGGGRPGVSGAPASTIQRQDGDPIPVDLVPADPEEVEELRERGIDLPSVSPETWEAIGGSMPTVYLCSIDLRTSPVGRHALFRIGSPAAGSETRSLQPFDQGADCWQGVPLRNEPFDQSADADCQATAISANCLERAFRSYPIGHYCTLGPNSNTFVGHLARTCGLSDPDPPGWTPGIGDSPPPSGTFAPDKWTTLIQGCSTKTCIFERERRPDEPVPV